MTNTRITAVEAIAEDYGFKRDPGMSGELTLWGPEGAVVILPEGIDTPGWSMVQRYDTTGVVEELVEDYELHPGSPLSVFVDIVELYMRKAGTSNS